MLCFKLSCKKIHAELMWRKKIILVNGGWTEWTGWGECTASCGGGTHKRSRTCTAPAPGEGGAPCDGQPEEEEPCGTEACGRVN